MFVLIKLKTNSLKIENGWAKQLHIKASEFYAIIENGVPNNFNCLSKMESYSQYIF